MVYLVPGDPASIALGPRVTAAMKEMFRQRMGLDQPLVVQLWRLISNVCKATSALTSGEPQCRADRAGGFAVHAGPDRHRPRLASRHRHLQLGRGRAVARRSWADRMIGVLSVSAIAIPSFIVAIYSLLIFAVWLKWLPAIGAGAHGELGDQLIHLILPPSRSGSAGSAISPACVRASMLEVMGENHVRTARAFGLPEQRIFRYALPIAILPTIDAARGRHRQPALRSRLRRDRFCPPGSSASSPMMR